jgi:hypothetical protein
MLPNKPLKEKKMFSKLIVGGATSSAETAVLSALSSKQGFFRAACTSACTSVSFDNPVVHETYQE